jgi:hypothetical protein
MASPKRVSASNKVLRALKAAACLGDGVFTDAGCLGKGAKIDV